MEGRVLISDDKWLICSGVEKTALYTLQALSTLSGYVTDLRCRTLHFLNAEILAGGPIVFPSAGKHYLIQPAQTLTYFCRVLKPTPNHHGFGEDGNVGAGARRDLRSNKTIGRCPRCVDYQQQDRHTISNTHATLAKSTSCREWKFTPKARCSPAKPVVDVACVRRGVQGVEIFIQAVVQPDELRRRPLAQRHRCKQRMVQVSKLY